MHCSGLLCGLNETQRSATRSRGVDFTISTIAGTARAFSRPIAMTSIVDGVDPVEKKSISRHRSEGIIPLPQLRDLPVWSSGGLTGGQRRRMLRDVNGVCNTLNWMHGEGSRPTARPPSLVATEDKNQRLHADVQQRVVLTGMRWVDADSAIDEHEALAKLLKRRTVYAPGVSSNVSSYVYSRVSLADSVVDAPPLVEMLPAATRFFSRSSSHGCCCLK